MRNIFSRYEQIGAYLLIVIVAVLAFARIESVRAERADDLAAQTEQRQNERVELTNELCTQSKINREALRMQILATADLAEALVPAQNPELVNKVVEFEAVQLANLSVIDCEENG